jgi:hypothetical protein
MHVCVMYMIECTDEALHFMRVCDCICDNVLYNRDNEVTVAPNTAEAQSHIAPLLSSGLYHHKIDSTGLTTYAVTGTTSSYS